MESEIQGLEDLSGYFVQQDKVVAIRFHPRPKRGHAAELVERIIPPVEHRPLDPEAAEAAVEGGTSDPKEKGQKKSIDNDMDLGLFAS